MKIQKAIMSVDDNPLYSDFWLPVSEVWKKRFDIDPTLIYFGNKKLDESYGKVIYIKPLESVPLYLQTQWARFWYTSMEPNTTFIISDIDMFPISKKYFIEQLVEIDSDKYVHLNGDHRPICVCYHVARGKKFKEVLNLADTFSQSMEDLICSDGANIVTHMGFKRWGLDEAHATKEIFAYEKKSDLIFLPRTPGKRIDRSDWIYNPVVLENEDYYIDSHSIRPYKKYKIEIDKLVGHLIDEF